MLIVISTMLFSLHAGLDPPTVTAPQVTAFMHIVTPQSITGNPCVASIFCHNITTFFVDLIPLLFTNHNMHGEIFLAIIIRILDIVDPPKILVSFLPNPPQLVVRFKHLAGLSLFPHRWQTFVRQHPLGQFSRDMPAFFATSTKDNPLWFLQACNRDIPSTVVILTTS